MADRTPPPPPGPGSPPPPMPKALTEKQKKKIPTSINFEEASKKHKEKAEAQKALMPGIPKDKPIVPPPVLKKARTKEEVQLLVDRYLPLANRLRVRALAPDAHLGAVANEVLDPSRTLLALDFDQTLTEVRHIDTKTSEMKIRGGDESKQALRQLHNQGAKIIVITAQPPDLPVVANLEKELRRLELADLFGVEAFDPKPVLDLVRAWGENYDLSLDLLRRKLAMLITLNTPRFPVDLVRIGGPMKTSFSNSAIKPESNGESTSNPQIPNDVTPQPNPSSYSQPVKDGIQTDADAIRGHSETDAKPVINEAQTEGGPGKGDVQSDSNSDSSVPNADSFSSAAVALESIAVPQPETSAADAELKAKLAAAPKDASDVKKSDQEVEVPEKDIDEVSYYMMQVEGNSSGNWSSKLVLKRPENYGEDVCPARCWKAYLNRTSHLRQLNEEKTRDVPERLFITHAEPVEPVPADSLVSEIQSVLEEAKVPTKFIDQLLREVIVVSNNDGVQLARKYHTFASRYNKPQALEVFLAEHPEIDRVIFVDDNSDNAWKMFEHFSTHSKAYNVTSCWFTPPDGGKHERFDPSLRENIKYLLDAYHGVLNLDGLESMPDAAKLNRYFRNRSYWVGFCPTIKDAVEFEKFLEPPSKQFMHLWRWYSHIASFPSHVRAAWPDPNKAIQETAVAILGAPPDPTSQTTTPRGVPEASS